MKKLVLLLVLAATAAVAALPAGAASTPPTTVLHFFDLTVVSSQHFSNGPNQPPQLGDGFAFHDNVYTWNGAKRGKLVGHVDAIISIIPPRTGMLQAVASLPGGELTIVGKLQETRVAHYAVTGGTGSYAGVRGEVTVTGIGSENSNRSAITVRLWQ